MLDTLTMDFFEPHLGDVFRVVVNDRLQVEAMLTSVSPWGEGAARGRPRVPFSLVFHASPEALLPQQIYRVEHDALPAMELFLVPLGPDAHGMRFEAVFT